MVLFASVDETKSSSEEDLFEDGSSDGEEDVEDSEEESEEESEDDSDEYSDESDYSSGSEISVLSTARPSWIDDSNEIFDRLWGWKAEQETIKELAGLKRVRSGLTEEDRKLLQMEKGSPSGSLRQALKTASKAGVSSGAIQRIKSMSTGKKGRQKGVTIKLNARNLLRPSCKLSTLLPIDPDGNFRMFWNLTSAFFIVWTMIFAPVYLCVYDLTLTEPTLNFIEWFINGFFGVDILLNFVTAYWVHAGGTDDQNLQKNFIEIAKHYVRTWFCLDVLATTPFELFMSGQASIIGVLKVARLLRLLRIAKLRALVTKAFLFAAFDFRAQAAKEILTAVVVIVLFAHWTACAWCSTADWAWIAEYDPLRFVFEDVSDINDLAFQRWLIGLNWAVTVLTIGSTDPVPQNDSERAVLAVACLLNIGIVASIVGSLTRMVLSNSEAQSEVLQQLKVVGKAMQETGIPRHIVSKIKNFLVFQMGNASTHKCLCTLEVSLPPNLFRELRLYMLGKKYVAVFPVIRNFGTDFLLTIMNTLSHHMCSPQDVVVQEGEESLEMIFLLKGTLGSYSFAQAKNPASPLLADRVAVLPNMTAFCWFNEHVLLEDPDLVIIHEATVLCLTISELLVLPREDFEVIVQKNSEWRERMKELRTVYKTPDADLGKMLGCARCQSRSHYGDQCPLVGGDGGSSKKGRPKKKRKSAAATILKGFQETVMSKFGRFTVKSAAGMEEVSNGVEMTKQRSKRKHKTDGLHNSKDMTKSFSGESLGEGSKEKATGKARSENALTRVPKIHVVELEVIDSGCSFTDGARADAAGSELKNGEDDGCADADVRVAEEARNDEGASPASTPKAARDLQKPAEEGKQADSPTGATRFSLKGALVKMPDITQKMQVRVRQMMLTKHKRSSIEDGKSPFSAPASPAGAGGNSPRGEAGSSSEEPQASSSAPSSPLSTQGSHSLAAGVQKVMMANKLKGLTGNLPKGQLTQSHVKLGREKTRDITGAEQRLNDVEKSEEAEAGTASGKMIKASVKKVMMTNRLNKQASPLASKRQGSPLANKAEGSPLANKEKGSPLANKEKGSPLAKAKTGNLDEEKSAAAAEPDELPGRFGQQRQKTKAPGIGGGAWGQARALTKGFKKAQLTTDTAADGQKKEGPKVGTPRANEGDSSARIGAVGSPRAALTGASDAPGLMSLKDTFLKAMKQQKDEENGEVPVGRLRSQSLGCAPGSSAFPEDANSNIVAPRKKVRLTRMSAVDVDDPSCAGLNSAAEAAAGLSRGKSVHEPGVIDIGEVPEGEIPSGAADLITKRVKPTAKEEVAPEEGSADPAKPKNKFKKVAGKVKLAVALRGSTKMKSPKAGGKKERSPRSNEGALRPNGVMSPNEAAMVRTLLRSAGNLKASFLQRQAQLNLLDERMNEFRDRVQDLLAKEDARIASQAAGARVA